MNQLFLFTLKEGGSLEFLVYAKTQEEAESKFTQYLDSRTAYMPGFHHWKMAAICGRVNEGVFTFPTFAIRN